MPRLTKRKNRRACEEAQGKLEASVMFGVLRQCGDQLRNDADSPPPLNLLLLHALCEGMLFGANSVLGV